MQEPNPATSNLLPTDGELYLFERAIPAETADRMLKVLNTSLTWRQDHARIAGREVALPRLTAWYGDRGYRYSGVDNKPQRWNPNLLDLKDCAEKLAGRPFNSMLANLYRDGRDSMGWHADAEKPLGRDPVIASISLGSTRRFQLKHRLDKGQRLSLDLTHGSCLVMAGSLQHHWLHQVPKTSKPVGTRINLTFRWIIDPSDVAASAERVDA